ncbi:hypothetical protein HID58_095313, partial [Brassica napus]
TSSCGGDGEKQRIEDKEQYGVLLYYKYTSVPDVDELVSFLNLAATRSVGGKLTALEEHIASAKSNCLFEGTDFKLASCNHPLNDKVSQECGFTSLSIRVVEELVTFSTCPLLKSPDISNAGKHLSAAEFHSVLESAKEQTDESGKSENKELVLLDARNLYETRIGKFESENVETLDPEIRQYSDLPTWIDQNAEKLKGKNVLMYCTGGIRCEMASAYIRSKGAGFENTFQLYGGIQRYLEQFPSGGFFKGKNFDLSWELKEDIIGCCLLCNNTFDDYSPRCRCRLCRMLVLVCNHCQVKGDEYVCELCRKHGKDNLDPSKELTPAGDDDTRRKLRILCLHGFRQNASGFKGRTGSLAKKLKNIAELVFIDAPHELQFIYQTATNPPPPLGACNKKFAWLVSPDFDKPSETGWTQCQFDPLQYQNQTEGFDKSLTYLKTVFAEKGPFDGILGFSQGAAMAAAVCGKQEQLVGEIDFRFCVLCSGFTPWPLLEKREQGSIKCPSLHIFGSQPGKDRQIVTQASSDLQGCATVIEHDFGHIIPTKSPYIDEIKTFLNQFV